MKVESRREAWAKANVIFPTDYVKDEVRSEKAGYNIYYSTKQNTNAWISDLGNRLEINLETGETINIWIEEYPKFKECQIEDALSIISQAIYDIDDEIDARLANVTGIKEARNKLYGAYKVIAKILKEQHPNSKLYEEYNLQEA